MFTDKSAFKVLFFLHIRLTTRFNFPGVYPRIMQFRLHVGPWPDKVKRFHFLVTDGSSLILLYVDHAGVHTCRGNRV